MYALQKSIELNNSQIASDEKLMNSYKSQLKRLENEVILGAATERDLNNLEYQISKLETTISLAQSENEVLAKQINDLKNNKAGVQKKEEPATFSP
jgi:cell division protein FtsL